MFPNSHGFRLPVDCFYPYGSTNKAIRQFSQFIIGQGNFITFINAEKALVWMPGNVEKFISLIKACHRQGNGSKPNAVV